MSTNETEPNETETAEQHETTRGNVTIQGHIDTTESDGPRYLADGETVAGSSADDLCDERTEAIPSELELEDLDDADSEIVEAAASHPAGSRTTIAQATTRHRETVGAVLQRHWPAHPAAATPTRSDFDPGTAKYVACELLADGAKLKTDELQEAAGVSTPMARQSLRTLTKDNYARVVQRDGRYKVYGASEFLEVDDGEFEDEDETHEEPTDESEAVEEDPPAEPPAVELQAVTSEAATLADLQTAIEAQRASAVSAETEGALDHLLKLLEGDDE